MFQKEISFHLLINLSQKKKKMFVLPHIDQRKYILLFATGIDYQKELLR